MFKKFLKNCFRILKISQEYKKGKIKLKNPPIRLWVEPTNNCNLKCIMCIQRMNKDKKGFMDFKTYKKIIDEAKDFVIDINLFGGGESLLHPKIIDMIKYAKKNKLRVRIETNATLLTKKLSKQIIKNKVDFISFSFDGYTKETYEKIRVNAHYEKTLENILNFLKIKKSLKFKKPFTFIQVIEISKLKKIDKKKKKDFFNKFKNLPVDGFRIIKPHRFAGAIDKEVTGNVYAYTENKKRVKYVPCAYPWTSMSILWDGRVVPCCIDFWAKYKLGDVKKESLRKIWNNKQILNLRKKLVSKNYPQIKLCKDCDFLWQKTIFGIPVKNIKDFFTFLRENFRF